MMLSTNGINRNVEGHVPYSIAGDELQLKSSTRLNRGKSSSAVRLQGKGESVIWTAAPSAPLTILKKY